MRTDSVFGFRPFLWLTAVIAGAVVLVPADVSFGLAVLWSGFAILFGVVNSYRHGLRAGLRLPTFALLIVGILGGAALFGAFVVAGIFMALVSAILVSMTSRAQAGAAGDARTDGDDELVSVAARRAPGDISAADVLASFGLGSGDRE